MSKGILFEIVSPWKAFILSLILSAEPSPQDRREASFRHFYFCLSRRQTSLSLTRGKQTVRRHRQQQQQQQTHKRGRSWLMVLCLYSLFIRGREGYSFIFYYPTNRLFRLLSCLQMRRTQSLQFFWASHKLKSCFHLWLQSDYIHISYHIIVLHAMWVYILYELVLPPPDQIHITL